MLRRARKRLTFANVTSLLALFFAIGGSAYAAVIVTSNDDVAPDTIAGHKPGAGKHSNLILGSVTNEDLAPETVKTGRITDGTVAARDLAADAVDTTKIKDHSVGAADLAPDSVGPGALADTTFYEVGGATVNDPVGGPPTDEPLFSFGVTDVVGRCSESSAGVVTAKVIVRSGLKLGVDSTAPGGVNDVSSPSQTEVTLASLGPTTGTHIANGSYGLTRRDEDNIISSPSTGLVLAATHVGTADCDFSATGLG
jgi:hypothetical protein